MRFLRFVFALSGAAFLTACASDPRTAQLANPNANLPRVAAAYQEGPVVLTANDFVTRDFKPAFANLMGRTITVNSVSDIRLRPKEVVLTFDDGPVPGRTDAILAALDRYGVKATFLMVGQMARAHPQLARAVSRRGHSVGSHTYSHPNLKTLGHDAAVSEIRKGEQAIRSAGIHDIAFFRFPYLADTPQLRGHLAARGITTLDVDVDSKDYFKVSPAHIVEKTMENLARKGGGVILMHDLQPRTAAMLPSLLHRLRAGGYKVVHLKAGHGSDALIASSR